MATRTELGDDFYVFSTQLDITDAKRWSSKGSCIIDCHGRQAIARPGFVPPPGITIHFYVNDTTFLKAGEVRDGDYWYVDAVHEIATGEDRQGHPMRSIQYSSPMVCPNYVLSKQHKAHGKPASGRYAHVGYDDIEAYLDKRKRVSDNNDIITVRNRGFTGGDPTLYDFLRVCKSHGYPYTQIRCCFCRGGIKDAFKDLIGMGQDQFAGGLPA